MARQTLEFPERLVIQDNSKPKIIRKSLPFQKQRLASSEGHSTFPLPRGPSPQAQRNPGPSEGASPLGKKTQCRSLFLCTKGLCALLLLELPPGPPPNNFQEGGQRAIFQRPPVYLGNKPTPPQQEGSSGGRPSSPTPVPQETAAPGPRPAPPRRAAPPADKTREGPKG